MYTNIHIFTHSYSAIQTDQVASHTTEDVDDANTQPPNGPLYLDANVELYGKDDDQMDHSQVNKDGCEEAPELLGVGGQWIRFSCSFICLFSNQHCIKPTDVLQTVHLKHNMVM